MMEQDLDLKSIFGGGREEKDPEHRINMHDENNNIIDRALHILLEAWSVLRGVYGGLDQFNVGINREREVEDKGAVDDARDSILQAVAEVRLAIDTLDYDLQQRRKADEQDGKPEDGKKPGDYL